MCAIAARYGADREGHPDLQSTRNRSGQPHGKPQVVLEWPRSSQQGGAMPALQRFPRTRML